MMSTLNSSNPQIYKSNCSNPILRGTQNKTWVFSIRCTQKHPICVHVPHKLGSYPLDYVAAYNNAFIGPSLVRLDSLAATSGNSDYSHRPYFLTTTHRLLSSSTHSLKNTLAWHVPFAVEEVVWQPSKPYVPHILNNDQKASMQTVPFGRHSIQRPLNQDLLGRNYVF